MKPLHFFFLIVLSFAMFSSCSKSDDSQPCDVSTNPTTAGAAESVSYSANKIGNATMSSLTYGGANGDIMVNNPTLPFSMTVNVPQGASISVSASGKSSSGGGLAVGFVIQNPNNPEVQADTCLH
jgi:hypothetical protein